MDSSATFLNVYMIFSTFYISIYCYIQSSYKLTLFFSQKQTEEELPSPTKEGPHELNEEAKTAESEENLTSEAAAPPSVDSPTSPPKSPAKKTAPNFACSTPMAQSGAKAEATSFDDDSGDDVIEEQSTVTSFNDNDDTLTQHMMLGRGRRLNREQRSILSGGTKQGWTKDNAG